MKQQKPILHARDHLPGGADPMLIGHYHIKVFPDKTFAELAQTDLPVTAGTNLFVFAIPQDLDKSRLKRAEAFLSTAGTTDTHVQIRNVTQARDLLSTVITVAAGAFSSRTAVQAVPITGDPALCNWGDLIAVNVTAAGTGSWGLGVILAFTR